MKTIHKFVLKSYLGPMVLTFFIVMFVLIMQFIWRYVDDLVGKGLGMEVISELMFYAGISSMPMGLPLSTMLAAIMTMGNLGENYELLAMKSAGMSLGKIARPLIFVVVFVSMGSFFVANNLVPWAMRRTFALIYDINQKKQELEFKDGIFFNGIDNMSIRVARQHPETKLLTNVLIYDTRDANGNMNTTRADSGYIRLSDDKKFLLVTLYHGETYEQTRNYQWYDKSALRRQIFEQQDGIIPLSGFAMERTDSDLFSSGQTKNIAQLEYGIDSLTQLSQSSTSRSYDPLLRTYIFPRDTTLLKAPGDSLRKVRADFHKILLTDSLATMDVYQKKQLWADAKSSANSSRGMFSFDEDSAKEALNQLYKYKVEWHRKMSLPVSIMIFFLIGASLGAIIRKGGLGMPVVVSVLFFVIYYIISITGEKLAREGTWASFTGMWVSTFILLPLSIFLIYKATNDSRLFNVDWYYNTIMKWYRKNLLQDYLEWTEKLTDRLLIKWNKRKQARLAASRKR
ncbi:MAG: LptF/LptG family permease [Rikenellaceae bacterium]|jgi:lipopolysaccharide export system permease protein|nr:LptF/LptG family permease [Rikenellaceae bacterium]